MEKKNLLILFGGRSTEHEVSCRSALYVIRNADREAYRLLLVGIRRDGSWCYVEDEKTVEDGSWSRGTLRALLSPDCTDQALYVFSGEKTKRIPVSLIFPVLHGLNGEDGTVQGLFTLSGIPYVGCGVLASALSMDKLYTKIIVDALGIRQAAYVGVHRRELSRMDEVIERIESKLNYPVFIKPSCAGSSIGIHKASDREELREALLDASRFDARILAEETLYGREVECAVMGDGASARAAGVGEVIAAAEFYDYDAKYRNAASVTDTDPRLPAGVKEEIMAKAVKIFGAVGGFGLSRVDFFFTEQGVIFNEINTLPGFTDISMYPMLFEAAGMSKKELVQSLLDTAYTREEH